MRSKSTNQNKLVGPKIQTICLFFFNLLFFLQTIQSPKFLNFVVRFVKDSEPENGKRQKKTKCCKHHTKPRLMFGTINKLGTET